MNKDLCSVLHPRLGKMWMCSKIIAAEVVFLLFCRCSKYFWRIILQQKLSSFFFFYFLSIFFSLTAVYVAMTASNLKTICSSTLLQFSMLFLNGADATLLQSLEGQAASQLEDNLFDGQR